jgi:tetratricopeptide (TPR) repeat protein
MSIGRSSARAVRRGLLLSLLLHSTVLVLLALLLQPAGNGANRPLTLEASTENPPPEPETLVVSKALVLPSAGELLSQEDDRPATAGQPSDFVSSELAWPTGRAGSGSSATRKRGSGAGASFFGTVAYGDQFVYVVDISTSMDRGQGLNASEGSRFARAMEELLSSIDRLSPAQSFYVILFNGETRRMFDETSVFPKPLPATPENKQRLNDWLTTVRTGEWTDPRAALKLGLAMRPSALFLLSDGEFNGQQRGLNAGLLNGNPSVTEVIDRYNRGGTPIHTVAYEDKSSCKQMELIAHSTGGEYLFVAPHASAAMRGPGGMDLSNNRARYLLSRAETLESQGRWKQALAIYRRIERDFPKTKQAQAAAAKTQELSSNP